MESRITPATLFVNATHSFLSQLGAATLGATLQIEPGATIGNMNTESAEVVGNSYSFSTTILSSVSFSPGRIITISSGANIDTVVVDHVSPQNGSFLLTLGAGLQHNHSNGDPIVPVANTIGIDKAITIQGDPTEPPSSLFKSITLEYFSQNGVIGNDVLRDLSLSNVDGATSGNLAIVNNTFNTGSGSTAPINVLSQEALSITGDKFTVGTSASLPAVVEGKTNYGEISFDNDSIRIAGQVDSEGILLASEFGPITLSSDRLNITGTDGEDGIDINTTDDVTVNSTTVSMNQMSSGTALDLKQAKVSLSFYEI